MRNLLLIALLALLSGCNSELSFSEVREDSVNNEVRSFLSDVQDKNGAHLFFEKEKAVYVYLNESNVIAGEAATYFTDVNVEGNGETLTITYDTNETTDLSNQSLDHSLIYKINLDQQYDTIKAIRNGEESSFGTVSGN